MVHEVIDLFRDGGSRIMGRHFIGCRFSTANRKIVCDIDADTTDTELREFFKMLSDKLPDVIYELYERFGGRGQVISFEVRWV